MLDATDRRILRYYQDAPTAPLADLADHARTVGMVPLGAQGDDDLRRAVLR